MIDLHVHSNASDGSYSPSDLVNYALQKKLTAIALTDHDTIAGIERAQNAAVGKNITVIPGVELSTEYNGHEIHLLGLFLDTNNKEFIKYLELFHQERVDRNKKMVTLLQQNGISITIETLQEMFQDAVLTRAHFARYLYEHHYVSSITQAFERYLGEGCSCYVPRKKVTPQTAIEVIRMADGYPILAHPLLYHMGNNELYPFILECKAFGLSGIEAIYSLHSKEEEAMLIDFARENNLLITGGSDFHGLNKPDIDLGSGKGDLIIPDSILTSFNQK